jgi:hypothetical protein
MGRTIVFLSVVLILSFGAAIAQQRKSRLPANQVRVSKQQPTVHITFVRFGMREPRYNHESNEGVWLRVHNNTRWPLTFHGMDWFIDENQEVRVFYGVEEIPKPITPIQFFVPRLIAPPPPPGAPAQPPPQTEAVSQSKTETSKDCEAPTGDWGTHVVAPITLPPGKSMIFSVPRETLCKNLKIYLMYNYAWEKHDKHHSFDYEPEHRVYFEGSDLPNTAR